MLGSASFVPPAGVAMPHFTGVRPVWDCGFEDFFRPLVAEVGAAKHEKRRDHRWEEIARG
jgi:hypothetical protein